MTKGVRVYEHVSDGHGRPSVGVSPTRLALPSTGFGWIGVVNNRKNRREKIIAVGCEEGAMAVHFLRVR